MKYSKYKKKNSHSEKNIYMPLISNRSQGHVEMILSFVIFIGFVVAMFFFLNPTKENKVNYVSLDSVENILLDNLSVNYNYIAVILDSPQDQPFSVQNNFDISKEILVIDEKNNIVQSTNDYSALKINIQPKSGSNARLYKIYFSDVFNSYPAGNFNLLDRTQYNFGVLTLEKSVLWENINLLNKSYIEDYLQLKKNLKIKEDFEFTIYDINHTKIFFDVKSVHKLKNFFVLSRDIPLRIIDKDVNQRDIIINLKVW